MLTKEQHNERVEYAKNHEPTEFADRFRLKLSTAMSFYYSNRIKIHKKKEIDEKSFKEFSKNHTKKETAEKFGVCIKTIINYEHLYNVKCKKEKTVFTERNISIYEYSETHSMVDTATKFGISKQRVSGIRKVMDAKKKDTAC